MELDDWLLLLLPLQALDFLPKTFVSQLLIQKQFMHVHLTHTIEERLMLPGVQCIECG